MNEKLVTRDTFTMRDNTGPTYSISQDTGQKEQRKSRWTNRRFTVFSFFLVLLICLTSCSGSAPGTSAGSGSASGNPSEKGSGTASENDYFEQLKAGDQALQEGRIEDALSAYQKAMELNPAIPQAYHRIFDTYVRDERFDEALSFARNNYKNIDTRAVLDQRSENREEAYEMESSEYNGMTASNELAGFLTGYLDLGSHYYSCRDGIYPADKMQDAMADISLLQAELGDTALSDLYTQTEKIGTQYASILADLAAAGVDPSHLAPGFISENADGSDASEQYDTDLSDLSPETIAGYEARFRELLGIDPDLLFVYRDIAALYKGCDDYERAGEIYLESIQAMKDMKQRRSYVSKDAHKLFNAAFTNVYRKVHEAVSAQDYNSRGSSHSAFTFHMEQEETDEPSAESALDRYQKELDDLLREGEAIITDEKDKQDMVQEYTAYCAHIQELSDNSDDTETEDPSGRTQVEGDASLIMNTPLFLLPYDYFPDSGWIHLICGDGKGFGVPDDLVNLKTGKVIIGEEGAEPRICSDCLLQFEWRVRSSGEHTTFYSVNTDYRNADDPESDQDDFYRIIYDMDGNVLEETLILPFEDINIDDMYNQMFGILASAAADYPAAHRSNWTSVNIAVDGNDRLVQAGGITLRHTMDEAFATGTDYSKCSFDAENGILIVSWADSGTEVYKVR